jgi:hypothetical protein
MAAANPSISQITTSPNMVQGVSQQAPSQRRDSQCESQFDCINSVLEGCVARPPGVLVKLLAGKDWTHAFFNETFHGLENYLTGVDASGQPFAIDLADGTLCTVTSTAPNFNYLTAGGDDPKDKLRALVADDFTFLSNRQKTVALTGATSAAKQEILLFFVRATALGATYSVTIDGNTTSHTTSATVVESTSSIASALSSAIAGFAGGSTYTIQQLGSSFTVTKAGGGAMTVSTSDGNGDDYLRAFNGTARSFAQLPAKAPTGLIIKVRGEDNTGNDDFYVQWIGDPSTGYWQETLAPSTATTLDATTMPTALVCTGYRTFEYRQLTWGTRVAGDGISNGKDPSFVGKVVQDMIYHQRRLGLLWYGGTVFSKTDNAFVFFPDTVETLLATAPVDVKVSGGSSMKGPPILDFALQTSESLFLWAQKEQFRVSSGTQPFKQDSVEVFASMAYEYSPKAKPLPVGNFVFLGTDVGKWASLRALQLGTNGIIQGDTDLLSHVPRYVPQGIRELTASETLRRVIIRADGDKTKLFIFDYTYSSTDGWVQTAINTWRIPGGDILWVSLYKNSLRVLQHRAEGVAFLAFDMSSEPVDDDAGAEYLTRLDLRVDETAITGLTFHEDTNTTTFTLPYQPIEEDVLVVTRVDKVGGFTRGRTFPTVSVVGAVVTVTGDLTGYQFYVGQRITSERTASRFYVRSQNGSEPTDEIIVNRYRVSMNNTAYSRLEATLASGETFSETYEGRELGTASAKTGAPSPQEATIEIGVEASSRDVTLRIINDSFLPSAWQNESYDYDPVGWKGAK